MKKLKLVGAFSVLAFLVISDLAFSGRVMGRVEIMRAVEEEKAPAGARYSKRKTRIKQEASRPLEKELSDLVVYIKNARGRFAPPRERSHLDQSNLDFVPNVLPVLVGTIVDFTNNDAVYHNVFSFSPIKRFDLGRYPTGDSRPITFDKPGVVEVFCDIHSHMRSFVVVLENPYFSVVDSEGNFSIPNVPAGTYRLETWHPKLPPQTKEIRVTESGDTVVDIIFR